MSHQATDDFTPDRERAADSDAVVPVIDIAPFLGGDAAARHAVVEALVIEPFARQDVMPLGAGFSAPQQEKIATVHDTRS